MDHYRFVAKHLKAPEKRVYRARARVWLYSGMAGWHFVTIPVKTSKEIKQRHGLSARGWGSVPVSVSLGESVWRTSIFPDKKAGAYILPLKAGIRAKEGVRAKDMIRFCLTIG